jgi:hypothetical protein
MQVNCDMKRENLKSCKSSEFLKKEPIKMLSPKAIFIISFFFKGVVRLAVKNKFSPRQYQERTLHTACRLEGLNPEK